MNTPTGTPAGPGDDWSLQKEEWLEALRDVLREQGPAQVRELLRALQDRALEQGVQLVEATLNTPYRNTVPAEQQPPYPGDVELERRIEGWLRWNAMAMVLQASDSGTGVGGHIATYASAATLMEVALNHVLRGPGDDYGGDIVNFQPHAAPGVYARAFLEGRLTERQLRHFRRELAEGGGLPSYPHPRRLPDFWPCPTASMGLSTAISIYLARFAKYLENRGLKPANGGKVWCFIGDGEADEPEVLGTLSIAARERLDNLVLVINCNLQRLDGPVRGNGKIIQELERVFRGNGWNVLKVIWGAEWDPIFAADHQGILQRRMEEALDGDYQMYSVLPGEKVREHWVRGNPPLAELMRTLNDEQIRSIRRGGHDPAKVYAALERAVRSEGKPTVVLAKTIKGYGMGSGGEGRNIVHQKKSMSAEERLECARRFGVPLPEEEVRAAGFYRPPEDSEEMRYLRARRQALGGYLPTRQVNCPPLPPPEAVVFAEALAGSERPVSTTMALVRLLARLLRDPAVGRFVVPIVPDEARTFGMDGLFRQVGIYSAEGQRYRPVDADAISPYRESEQGQILQEGICEAGALASFIAAGTAYAHFGVPTVPFYIYYSMFGFQRVGDLIWAAGDNLCRGFLIGGTAGRTTLNGEGLQHQDGHSHVLASAVPCVVSYDPAFAGELAVIIRDGLRRMYADGEDVFYYVTVYNENYAHPPLPEGAEEGVLRGLYRLEAAPDAQVRLFGSGSILQQALMARELLAACGVQAEVWSVTSYTELHRDAIACEQYARHHPDQPARVPYLRQALGDAPLPIVAASDYLKLLPTSLAPWLPGPLVALGTDGFGLSESRPDLRRHFEVDAHSIAHAAIDALHRAGSLGRADLARATAGLRARPVAARDEA
jgi:pyruvate dehydrogenase E1 component